MSMRTVVWSLLAVSEIADAAPVRVAHSGRVLGSDGAPVEGSPSFELRLYPSASSTTPFHAESFSVTLQGGFYSVVLGEAVGNPLDSDELVGPTWVGVVVGGVELTPRQQLSEVPVAAVARSVRGDVVLAASTACNSVNSGALVYDGGVVKVCDGTAFQALVGGGAAGALTVQATSGVRAWSDGSVAKSCFEYRNPPSGHSYSGDVGSGVYRVDPDGTGPLGMFEVECDQTAGNDGWQLIYNRNNSYFTPDHMRQGALPSRLDFTVNATSWYIPTAATEWRWDISVDNGSTWRMIHTAIPTAARNTTHTTTSNVGLTVLGNTTLATGTFYYQTFTFADRSNWGCSSSGASWWGLVNVSMGAGDQTNPGIGGHCDGCSFNAHATVSDNYTWPNDDLELYLSNYKNVQGDGAGGTQCGSTAPNTAYRYRFWAR
jgi:hypothetical protein